MRRLLLTLSTLSLIAACGGGGSDDPVTPPATPAISISSSASSGTIARGASSTTTITLTRSGGFTGAVALAATGAPSGVTVSFAPQSIATGSTSSTVTISVDGTAAPGSSTISISASGSGVSGQTTTYALTIPTPAITITAGGGTATTAQGTTVTVPITVSRTNGASGAIDLTATGAPANTTVSFAPASIASGSTTSTMSLVVGGTTAVGTYSIVVSAASAGVTTQTATVALTVTAAATPGYTIAATPAALSIVAGQSSNVALALSRTGGFAGNVTLALEGAPSGVSGTFTPNPATANSSTLAITTTGAAVPGTYNVTVRGTAAGQTDRTIVVALTVSAAPGVAVTLAPTTLSIAQGATGQTAVTLARTGGLTGDITMSATGAPAGMTVAFNPATVTGTASTLTVTVGGAVATGTYPLTITGTGAGSVTGSATLSVTVAQAQGFTLAATNSSVVQGSTGTSTVTITRTGGFANNVDLTATNLPANVTASFAPASVSGTSSTITFTAAAGATPGTYNNVTVNGTGTGATNQSTTLSLTVTASGGGGGAIAYRFCDPARVPLWFAYKDGANGAWTRVTAGANNTYSFTINSSVGGVAYVQNQSGGGYQGVIMLNAASEFASIASQECTANAATKTLNATFAGLTNSGLNSQTGSATIAGGTGSASTSGTPFQIQSVQDRVADVYAYRTSITITPPATITQAIDKIVLRRNVNYPANGTVPAIDFDGAESFVPASATITLANAGGDQTSTIASFQTTNGFAGAIFNIYGASVLGVPANKTQAGDFHLLIANASAGSTSFRSVYQYNRDLVSRTLTFGSTLNLPTITTPGAGRVKVSGNWQSEYGEAGGSSMVQGSAASTRAWTINASRGYFGAAATQYEFELDNFSGVAGYLATWNLATGTATQVTTTFTGIVNGNYNVFAEGYSFRTASRLQTTTP